MSKAYVLVRVFVSVDHGSIKQPKAQPAFLRATAGDIVIVWDEPERMDDNTDAWWMGEIICVEGSAHDPKAPSLFQIADVDTGVIHWVNADCVQKAVMPLNERLSNVVPIR